MSGRHLQAARVLEGVAAVAWGLRGRGADSALEGGVFDARLLVVKRAVVALVDGVASLQKHEKWAGC